MIEMGSQSYKNQISLLYVDDEQDLLDLGKNFLERSGEFHVDIKISAQEALKSIQIFSYDAIVSDYQMPGMNGIEFLKAVRSKHEDIPFILFTGRGREEVVIEAINNGADFYIQKGGDPKPQYIELSHKIRQAVRRKHAEKSLKESENHYFDFIDSLSDATFAKDRSGRVIAWNRAIEEMTGISSDEILGTDNYCYAVPFFGFHRPLLIDLIDEPEDKILRYYPNVYRASNSLIVETDRPSSNGNQITTLIMVYHIYNQAGDVIGTVESIRDITDIKKTKLELKESEVKYQNLVEYSLDSIFIVGFDGIIHFVNRAGLLALDEEDFDIVIGKKNILEYIHPESKEKLLWDFNNVAQGIDAYNTQYKVITAKNREIWIEGLGRKIPYQNSDVILISSRDITERKRTENALRESEEQFRALTEQSPDIILRVDKNFRILYCNPKITEYTGLSLDNLIGSDSRKLVGSEEYIESWVRMVRIVFETGESSREEWKIGMDSWFDCLCYPEFGENKTVQVVISSIRNITLMKRNEEAREFFYKNLLAQREFTKALLNAIPIPVHWKDTNRQYMGCNQAFAKFVGLSQDEIIGKKVKEIWQNKEVKDICIHDRKLISTGFLPSYQTKLSDRTGKVHSVIVSNNLFRDCQGDIAGIVGSIQDITEINQLISDLKIREELFRMIITQSSDLFIIITPSLEISFISPRVEYLSGFLSEEVLGPVEKFVHPDDLTRVMGQIERLINNSSSSEVAEFLTLKRDGTYMLLEGVAVNCIDNPAIKGILITARDITSKRKTELELSRTNQLFNTVVNSSSAVFAILNLMGDVIFANQSFFDQDGSPGINVTKRSIKDFFPSEWEKNWEIIISNILQTKSAFLQEFELMRKDTNFLLSTIFFPIQDDKNFLIGFFGLDITEKKNLLNKLDETIVQNSVLEKMVQERTEIISNLLDLKDSLIMGIAHELRTPLTPLTILLPLLGEEQDHSKRMEIISVIENNTSRIANIVEKNSSSGKPWNHI